MNGIKNLLEKITKQMELIIVVIPLIISFFFFLFSTNYKIKAEIFYDVPLYLFEYDFFKGLGVFLFVLIFKVVYILMFLNFKKDVQNSKSLINKITSKTVFMLISIIGGFLLIFKIFKETYNTIKINWLLKIYESGEWFLVIVTLVVFLIYFTGTLKEGIYKRICSATIVSLVLISGLISLMETPSNPMDKKKYEFLVNENKVIISNYKDNYVVMDFKVDEKQNSLLIDTSSYEILPISHQKIQYKFFKEIKVSHKSY